MMNHRKLLFLATILLLSAVRMAHAQQRVWYNLNMPDQEGIHAQCPIFADSISYFDVGTGQTTLQTHLKNGMVIPFETADIDSMNILNTPDDDTKDPYRVYQLYIFTQDGEDITSRDEYVPCFIALNALGCYNSYSATAQIRGRGNSSWLWYDKKPFRLKLDKKHKLLGLGKAKSWVLLANYRDVTDLMNTFVFELGRWMGVPYSNHTRYVELIVNGDYRGVYQLTEQVQQGSNRVDIDDNGGLLVTLDVDDGPSESPDADDNFYSEVFDMPMAVKFPKDEQLTAERRDSIKNVFAELETAIKNKDFKTTDSLLDLKSFIHYLQIQEFVYNVELSAPRSIFMFKNKDEKWQMGPLWDFDAGYDFDWNNMYTGHTFFSNYKETVMGSNPYKRNGNYNYVPQFFTNLFGCPEFVKMYKEEWNLYADSIVSRNWEVMEKHLAYLRQGPMQRDADRWPISGKSFETEVEKMHQWLINRAQFMTELINDIPVPDDTPVTSEQDCGSLTVATTMDADKGYSQSVQVKVDKSKLLSLLGIDENQFNKNKVEIIPLNTDGTEGENHTNGTFGAWFDGDGNPGYWESGHVYIEIFDDLFNWNCGVHPYNCYEESHKVAMAFKYQQGETLKKVTINVNFTIDNAWGGW